MSPNAPERLKTTCGARSYVGLTGVETQAMQDNALVELNAANAALVAANTALDTTAAAIITAQNSAASAASGSNSAVLTPGGAGAMWNLDCSSNALSVNYKNADGSIVSPITFFLNGGDIDLTGNYGASKAASSAAGQAIVRAFFSIFLV